MSNLNDLIEIVGCDNPDRRGDVIFVHGLGGHARGTWHPQEKHNDDNFWPAWLGEDLKNVGVWSLGYEVEPFRWKGNSMPLADRATNILDLLDSYGIGDRPIIFITHSLGGLLVKQMLRNARDYGKWNAIASQTKGIVFLSTPHSGSDMASWIQHIGGILRTTVSVEELEAHHSRLRELNLLYRNDEQFSQIPMLVYCETRPTGPILVVNQTSADPGIKGVIPIPMDFDHISICKVGDRKSQIYRQIKRFIEKNLTAAQEIHAGKLQDNSRMTQSNYDNARGWQTKVEGGTAYIGEIHFHPSPNLPTLLESLESEQLRLTPLTSTFADSQLKKQLNHYIQALKDKKPGIRRKAVDLIEEIGSEEAIPILCKVLLEDEDSEVRRSAARALGKIGRDNTVNGREVGEW